MLTEHIESSQSSVININNNESAEQTGEETISPLSYLAAMKIVSLFAIPFTLSRIAVAVNVIGNGIVFAKLGDNAAASGSLSTTIIYAVAGSARTALLSTGIIAAKHHGLATEFERNNDRLSAENEYTRIGDISRQGLIFGTLLAIPSAGIMFGIGPLLSVMGISSDVVQDTRDILLSTMIGLLPIYWSTTDQQVALSIKYKNIPLIFGGAYAGLSMLIGYPLALGYFGLPKLGTTGLGYGTAAAAWISFLALRIYFWREEFNHYHLFAIKLSGLGNEAPRMAKLGFSMGFQAITDWGNLTVLSALLDKSAKNASIAALASIQCITAFTLATSGLGQTVSVQISNLLGQMDALQQMNHRQSMTIINSNIKKIGNAGIIIAEIASLAACGILTGLPKQIDAVFMNTDDVDAQTLLLAQAMLIANGIGFIIDTIRNIGASALSGSKDVLFAPIVSLITMSVMGLTVGGCLSMLLGLSANWLFITRDVGILLAAVAIMHRWLTKDYMPEMENNNVATPINAVHVSSTAHSFFSKAPSKDNSTPSQAANYATFNP